MKVNIHEESQGKVVVELLGDSICPQSGFRQDLPRLNRTKTAA